MITNRERALRIAEAMREAHAWLPDPDEIDDPMDYWRSITDSALQADPRPDPAPLAEALRGLLDLIVVKQLDGAPAVERAKRALFEHDRQGRSVGGDTQNGDAEPLAEAIRNYATALNGDATEDHAEGGGRDDD